MKLAVDPNILAEKRFFGNVEAKKNTFDLVLNNLIPSKYNQIMVRIIIG